MERRSGFGETEFPRGSDGDDAAIIGKNPQNIHNARFKAKRLVKPDRLQEKLLRQFFATFV